MGDSVTSGAASLRHWLMVKGRLWASARIRGAMPARVVASGVSGLPGIAYGEVHPGLMRIFDLGLRTEKSGKLTERSDESLAMRDKKEENVLFRFRLKFFQIDAVLRSIRFLFGIYEIGFGYHPHGDAVEVGFFSVSENVRGWRGRHFGEEIDLIRLCAEGDGGGGFGQVPKLDPGTAKAEFVKRREDVFGVFVGRIDQYIQIQSHADETVFGHGKTSADGVRDLVAIENPQQVFHVIGQEHAGCWPLARGVGLLRFGRSTASAFPFVGKGCEVAVLFVDSGPARVWAVCGWFFA